uniref:3-oxoacid CoA-transferase, subunit B n=1 Tax=Rhizobium meliloti TaxID=382 RepID=I2E1Y6_RHIML|nr:3-oxoacid CoA-transferase, subunit B [Sinorhizobium meliloti]
MEVAENGDLANWMSPASSSRAWAAAMDLVAGVKRDLHPAADRQRRG